MTRLTRIKICGITNVNDARTAVEAGTDALGFVFFGDSPRNIELNQAAEIIDELPPFVTSVGVFVNAGEEEIMRIVNICRLDLVQLHGDEPADLCRAINRRSIKAFRLKDESSLEDLPDYPVSAYLLDSFVKGKWGGTGQVFDWQLAIKAQNAVQAKKPHAQIILAGGLNPGNVASAIRKVRPYAVDVASGVEASPRRKDPARVRAFIQAVRAADAIWKPSS